MKKETVGKLMPLTLTLVIILIDQLTKLLIVITFPTENYQGIPIIGNFFSIIHARNTGIAFSLGAGMEGITRLLLMILLPLAILVVIGAYLWRAKDLTRFQRWCIAGILGGGLGNIIDRAFRPDGVIDFLKFNMYGLFGWQQFPTFNLADSAVVVCGIILMLSFAFAKEKAATGGKEHE